MRGSKSKRTPNTSWGSSFSIFLLEKKPFSILVAKTNDQRQRPTTNDQRQKKKKIALFPLFALSSYRSSSLASSLVPRILSRPLVRLSSPLIISRLESFEQQPSLSPIYFQYRQQQKKVSHTRHGTMFLPRLASPRLASPKLRLFLVSCCMIV